MMHYLIKFDGVIQSGFLVIPKIKSAELCKPVHDIQIIALWFEPGKCGKDGQNYKITDYLEKEKSFLDEIKSIFHRFWRAIIWFKNNYIHIINKFGEAISQKQSSEFNHFSSVRNC